MANEILYAGIGDLRFAEAASAEYLLLLAAREALPNHPALLYAGDVAGSGSAVLKVPHLGLAGYDALTATADGSAVANTALTDASTTVTVARYSKAYEVSDMARGTGMFLDPQVFAQDAVQSSASMLVSLIANLVDNFATTAGSTGVDLSVANYLTAIQTLEVANVAGPYMAVLHPQQVGDLRAALAAVAGGALQWMPGTQAQIQVLGNGFRGQFLGVDIFSTTFVPTANAGADRAGGMFGRGALVWADMTIPSSGDADQLIIGGKVMVERDRTARAGLTAHVTHTYLGATEGIDLCGVSVITDA